VAVSSRRGVHLPHVETRSQVHRLRSLKTKKPPLSGAICLLLLHCMKKFVILSIALFLILPSVSFASDLTFSALSLTIQYKGVHQSPALTISSSNVGNTNECAITSTPTETSQYGRQSLIASLSATSTQTLVYTFDTPCTVPDTYYVAIQDDGYFYDIAGGGSFDGSLRSYFFPVDSSGEVTTGGFTHFLALAPVYASSLSDTTTRIVSVTPSNGTTTATSTIFGFGTTVYTNVADYVDGMEVVIEYHNNYVASQNVVGVYASTMQLTRSLGEYHFPLNGSSQLSFSTTTNLQVVGKYRMTTKITKPRYSFFGFDFGTDTVVSTSTQFTVATSTAYDVFTEQVQNEVALFNPSACSFVGGDFSVCLGQLFIPREFYMKASIEVLKDEVVHIFPIGYFVDFVQILATTSTSTLQLVDAELPSVLAGGGSTLNITLDAHSMDMLWNATSSQFLTTKQNDTRSFFEITNGYWRILMVLLALMYILRRILGVSVIPEGLHDAQGTVYANGKGEYSRGGVRGRKGWGDIIQ